MSEKKTTPLVIGVTGHRNFAADDQRLGEIVEQECQLLSRENQAREFVIVSALAEGADRLVANIAMKVLQARLIVPLVLPAQGDGAYTMDFPDTVDEFKALLHRADEIIEAPILSKGDAWRQYTEQRTLQYAWGGGYLVEHCHILFALWDGKPARGTGGTEHVVNWFRKGLVPKEFSTRPNRGSLPACKPVQLIHINPDSGQVERKIIGNQSDKTISESKIG